MESFHRNKPNAERKAARLRRTGHSARAKKVNDNKWKVVYSKR